MIRSLLALAALTVPLLAACGGLVELGPEGPPPTLYTLQPLERNGSPDSDAVRLYVEVPQVPGALDTQRIAVRRSDRQIEYVAGARWSEGFPRLLQRHITISLDNDPALEAIGGFNIDVPVDYRLRIDVREHYAHVDGAEPEVRLDWSAQIIDNAPAKVRAVARFSARQAAGGPSAQAILAAYNEATNQLVTDLVAWAARETARETAPDRADAPARP